MNYGNEAVKDGLGASNDAGQFYNQFPNEDKQFPKGNGEFPKEFRKEFLAAQRSIYKLVSANPKITIAGMAKEMNVSDRQIKKYLQRLTDLKLIERQGGRKNGTWVITDEAYEKFFERF